MRLLAIACTLLGCAPAIAPAAEVRAPVATTPAFDDGIVMRASPDVDPLVCMPDTRAYETSAPIMPMPHEASPAMP